jgi:hypothetical protein
MRHTAQSSNKVTLEFHRVPPNHSLKKWHMVGFKQPGIFLDQELHQQFFSDSLSHAAFHRPRPGGGLRCRRTLRCSRGERHHGGTISSPR